MGEIIKKRWFEAIGSGHLHQIKGDRLAKHPPPIAFVDEEEDCIYQYAIQSHHGSFYTKGKVHDEGFFNPHPKKPPWMGRKKSKKGTNDSSRHNRKNA